MSSYYGLPPVHHAPPRRTLSPIVPLLVLLGVLVLGYWWWHGFPGRPVHDTNAVPRAVTPRGNLAEDEKCTIELYKNASPSVVHISTLALRQDYFTMDVQQIPKGTGSGFIWDEAGHVVTNYHVIQDANAAKVILADQTTFDAELVGAFPDRDLAVLHIAAPTTKLKPIPVGTSHDLQVGQKTYAIGNPFGLDQTLTTGIVSALGREIESVNRRAIKNVIQTDAAINPGNSGGPLLDSSGRLIGVNTAIYSTSGVSAGIGFAIPVDEVNRVVPQLIRHGKVERPTLGIEPAEDQLAQRIARRIGVQGIVVRDVKPGSPAAEAGIRAWRRDSRYLYVGDVVVALDGKPVRNTDEFYTQLEAHKAGDKVTVTVYRNDERVDIPLTLVSSS